MEAFFDATTKDKATLNQFKRDILYGDYVLDYGRELSKQEQNDKHRYMDVVVKDESPTYRDDEDVRDLRDKGRVSGGYSEKLDDDYRRWGGK